MSFRTDRCAFRTANEENKTLEVWHKISTLVSNKKIKTEAQDALLQIDSHRISKGSPQNRAYNELKWFALYCAINIFYQRQMYIDMLAEVLRKIEMLVHSKLAGYKAIGELTAVWVLFLLLLLLVVCYSWCLLELVVEPTGFEVEMFALMLTSKLFFWTFLYFGLTAGSQDIPFLTNSKYLITTDTGINNVLQLYCRDIQK